MCMDKEISWLKFINQLVVEMSKHGVFALLFLALLAGGAWQMYHNTVRMNQLEDYFRDEFAVVVIGTRGTIAENTEVLRETQRLLRRIEFQLNGQYGEGLMNRQFLIRVTRTDEKPFDKTVFAETEADALRQVRQQEDWVDVATGGVTFNVVRPAQHRELAQ